MVYAISEAEYARAKPIHAAHVEEWMNKPGVQGVGIGSSVDWPGEAALVIFLIRRVPHEPIPAMIDGLHRCVRESSRFRRPQAGARMLASGTTAPGIEARGEPAEAVEQAFRLKGDPPRGLSSSNRVYWGVESRPGGSPGLPLGRIARTADFEEIAMRRTFLVLAGFLLASAAVSLAWQQAQQEKPKDAQAPAEEYKIPPEEVQRPNPVKSTEAGLAQARKLYGYDCLMCHGASGDGKGELAETMKLTLHDWRDPETLKNRTDGELFYIISNGKGKMLGEGDRLKQDLRWNLVNLVRSFAKKDAASSPKP